MEPRTRPDPDFDPGPARLADLDPTGARRVVVNPFLAVLALILWGALFFRPVPIPLPLWATLATSAIVVVPWLVQFHCLDCGRTGPYPRLRRHECPGLLAPIREERRPRSVLPRPGTQLIFWCYLIGSATLILAVSGLARR